VVEWEEVWEGLSDEDKEKLRFIKSNSPSLGEFEEKFKTVEFGEITKYLSIHQNRITLNEDGEELMKNAAPSDVVERIKNLTESVKYYPSKTGEDVGSMKIKIDGEVFSLTVNQLRSPKRFCNMWFDRFKEYIKIQNRSSNPEWKQIMDYWGEMREVEEPDEIDDEQYLVDKVISKVERCEITRDINDTIDLDNKICYNSGNLLYPTKSLKNILDDSGVRVSMRRLRVLLDDFLSSDTEVKRTEQGPYRFWKFDESKLNIDVEKKLEDYEEGEE